jgi:predicted membrane channel-forming protein YqfA (hemolysin III family)
MSSYAPLNTTALRRPVEPGLYTLIWVVAIIAIFAPLAIRKYTTTGSTR